MILPSARDTAVPPESGFNWTAALLLAAGYFIGARLGLALAFPGEVVSTFWTANAILLAVLLLTPTRSWPLLLLVTLAVHLLALMGSGAPGLLTLGRFSSNVFEVLIGATIIRRYVGRNIHLDRFGNVGLFVAFVVFLGPFVSSFAYAAFTGWAHYGNSSFWSVWSDRFMSNSLAQAVVAPAILAWATEGLTDLRNATRSRWVEAAVLGAALTAVTIFVFVWQRPGPRTLAALLYIPLPLLLWASLRFSAAGSATALLVVVFSSIWNTVHGRGPFEANTPEANALSLQLLFAVMAITLMSLGSVLTERKRAQDAALEKGEQLQLALDAAQMGTWDWRLPEVAQWLQASERASTRPGDKPDIALYGFPGLIHPADLTRVSGAISHLTREGAPFNVEFRVVRPDGALRWLLGKGKVVFDKDSRPVRMIGLAADITERKNAELLSAGENRILEMIATGAPLKEILTSLALLIEAETPGLICGVMMLDPDGVSVRPIAAPTLPESYSKAIDGARIGPKAGSCGTAMFLGQPVIVRDVLEDARWEDYRDLAVAHGLRACWSTPIMSEQGKVLGSFAMYYREPKNPTADEVRLIEVATQLAAIAIERKHTEREIHEQRRELAHLGRAAMLGEISGALAHELMQPLTAVLTNAQVAQRLMARTPPELTEMPEILSDIVAAERRASDVIHRLRTMLAKGQTQLVPVDLNEVITDTLKLARSEFTAREVTFARRTPQDLPLVMGDRVQLQQVLLNLIINACDAMINTDVSERRLAITASVSRDGQTLRLAVTDRGSGVPRELLDRIFDPFITSKEHGLGLGLSICRSIVRTHGGQLTVVNNPERGATFSFSLPVLQSVPLTV